MLDFEQTMRIERDDEFERFNLSVVLCVRLSFMITPESSKVCDGISTLLNTNVIQETISQCI